MKLESQVVSLELAQKLKELGVMQESYFSWYTKDEKDTGFINESYRESCPTDERFSAFTVAEFGELLPLGTQIWKYLDEKQQYKWAGKTPKSDETFGSYDTEANGKARMLVYLLENNLIPNNTTE